jgi:protein subunit release factor B
MDSDYRLPPTDEALLAECDVAVFRGSGPGGQSVNTSDSAVRLTHRPTGLVVVCRRERSQLLNKRACLRRLRERIAEAQHVDPERRPTKPSRGAKERRLQAKRVQSARKRNRNAPPLDE